MITFMYAGTGTRAPSTRRRRGCGWRTGWVHVAKADTGTRLDALLEGLEFAVPVAVLAAGFDQTPWRVAVRRAASRHIETQSRRQRGSHNCHRQSELGHKCLRCETYLLVGGV